MPRGSGARLARATSVEQAKRPWLARAKIRPLFILLPSQPASGQVRFVDTHARVGVCGAADWRGSGSGAVEGVRAAVLVVAEEQDVDVEQEHVTPHPDGGGHHLETAPHQSAVHEALASHIVPARSSSCSRALLLGRQRLADLVHT